MKDSTISKKIVAVVLQQKALLGRLEKIRNNKAIISFYGDRKDQIISLKELFILDGLSDRISTEKLPTSKKIINATPTKRKAGDVWWFLTDQKANQQASNL